MNVLAVSLAALLVPSAVGIRPSFHMPSAAWAATHVVVADAAGRVTETWHGGLRPGDRLPVAKFEVTLNRPVGGADAVSWHHGGRTEVTGPTPAVKAKRVTGSRVVYFLVAGVGHGRGKVFPDGWQPAGPDGEFDTSMAWVESDQVFALVQTDNPGPSRLVLVGETELAFKKRVLTVIDGRRQLEAVLAVKDPADRAGRLSDLRAHDDLTTTKVIEALPWCGKPGTAVLGSMLADVSLDWCREYTLTTLIAAEPKAGAEVVNVLESELRFWREASEKKLGWLNRHPDAAKRYARLHLFLAKPDLFRGLPDNRVEVLRRLSTLWLSDPTLIEFERGQQVPVRRPLAAALAVVDSM